MIIPIRCFTCNNVIGSKYNQYLKLKKEEDDKNKNKENNITISNYNIDKLNDYKIVFTKIGVERYCCKRHLISHIDLILEI